MPISEQIREALIGSSLSRYRISKDLGISQARLSKFVHGTVGLSMDALDQLAEYLGLEVRSKDSQPTGTAARPKQKAKGRGK